MISTEAGIVIVFNDEHPSKAHSSISIMLLKMIVSNLSQPSNAEFFIISALPSTINFSTLAPFISIFLSLLYFAPFLSIKKSP